MFVSSLARIVPGPVPLVEKNLDLDCTGFLNAKQAVK
jgi:hypothetical protein